jgi:hypothetical protein
MAARSGWCPATVRDRVNAKSATATLGHRGDNTIAALSRIVNGLHFDRRDAMNPRIGLCD